MLCSAMSLGTREYAALHHKLSVPRRVPSAITSKLAAPLRRCTRAWSISAGEVVTREELRGRLWPADTFVVFDHRLAAAVSKLRDALADSAEDPRFVETIGRRGYRFMVPVESVERAPGHGQRPGDEEQVPTVQGTYAKTVSSDQLASPHPSTPSKSTPSSFWDSRSRML
jgi:DNA-binding winged helix-turn-helix (wHTH) protein